MSYNNFSNWYKEILVHSENRVKKMWLKELNIEDVFLDIVTNSKWWIREIFNLYWINEKLVAEIVVKWIFNETIEKRKWKYLGMSARLKKCILWSVKIAANFSKSKASLEDLLLSILKNDAWLTSFLDYIWIIPTDLETNLKDINKSWIIDWTSQKNNENNQTTKSTQSWWEEIDSLLWKLSQNLFSGIMNAATPFDRNQKQTKKEDSTTPALDFFSINLTKEAKEWKIEKIIWRDNEIERLIAILNRKTKNNPVLVWEPWVGKTAIAEWLALKIVGWQVPFSMRNKKILALDMSSMVAWTKYRWEFESRIKQVINEASKVENEIILFIDEIHTMIWAGSWEGTLDASNILKPAMWRWKIRVIWATTGNEYKKYIEKDSALERRFQKIITEEPSKEVTIEIIRWLKESFEEYHNLNIKDEAVKEAVELSIRYVTDKYLPDKAIDLVDEACSLKSMKYNIDEVEIKKIKEKVALIEKEMQQAVIAQSYKKAQELKQKQEKLEKDILNLKQKFTIPKNERFSITDQDIQRVLSMSTGIPVSNLSRDEIEKLKNLPKNIKTKIIWQDEAINSIVKSIMKNKIWIWNPNRPLWSFLFLWPTWVGKTELIKVLTKEFYENNDSLIKIDMSEYSDKTSVNKLIGSSAWYVWYEDGWFLTEKIRKKPYSVILFDEIEKWDFEVYNILLQILEDWVLTDNKWKKVNFKNTIIVMTSNLWSEKFNEKAAQIWFDVTDSKEEKIMRDYEKAKEDIKWTLTDHFSPEFINRIDKIVIFNPLDKKDIKTIVNLQMKEFKERLKDKSIELKYNLKVINFITKFVYNPDFWAREIRRFINDNIEDIIAEKIVNNQRRKKFELVIEKNELVVK